MRLTAGQRIEREATRAQLLAERQAAKATKRAENKSGWSQDPRNANYQREQKLNEIVAEIAAPAAGDARSLDALRHIMQDGAVPIGRRVEAAECVLGFELPAAALARATADPVASSAYTFLKQIVATPGVPEALKLKALKALSAIEAAKPSRGDPAAASEQREMLRALINAERRRVLQEAGCWLPPKGSSWALASTDSFEVPPGFSSTAPGRSITGIGDALNAASSRPEAEREACKALLLGIEATNRPDRWRDLLHDGAVSR